MCNVGLIDRLIRIILGITLLVIAKGALLGIIGFILVFTGLMGFCGAYKVFGNSTCGTKKS